MSLWQVYTEFNAQQSSILALEMKWSRKSNTWRWRTPSCILFYCTLILGNLSKHFLHQPHSNTPRTQPRPFPTGAAIVVWHHGCSLVKLGWMDVPRSTLRDVPWYITAQLWRTMRVMSPGLLSLMHASLCAVVRSGSVERKKLFHVTAHNNVCGSLVIVGFLKSDFFGWLSITRVLSADVEVVGGVLVLRINLYPTGLTLWMWDKDSDSVKA